MNWIFIHEHTYTHQKWRKRTKWVLFLFTHKINPDSKIDDCNNIQINEFRFFLAANQSRWKCGRRHGCVCLMQSCLGWHHTWKRRWEGWWINWGLVANERNCKGDDLGFSIRWRRGVLVWWVWGILNKELLDFFFLCFFEHRNLMLCYLWNLHFC